MATNRGESVKAKLQNVAKATGQDMLALSKRFACERLMARLVEAGYGERIALVGNHLLWASDTMQAHARPTVDLDLHDYGVDESTRPSSAEAFEAFMMAASIDLGDGVAFEALDHEEMEHAGDSGGVRIGFKALIHTMAVPSYVDMGFGWRLPETCKEIDYHSTLSKDFPPIRILALPLPHVAGQKVCAILKHGMENTRGKDYYDLLMLKRRGKLADEDVVAAIAHEAADQGRTIPREGLPPGLTEAFATMDRRECDRHAGQEVWNRTLKKYGLKGRAPESFPEVVAELRDWLQPLIVRAARKESHSDVTTGFAAP